MTHSPNTADTSTDCKMKLGTFGSLFLQLKLPVLLCKELLRVNMGLNVKCHQLQQSRVQYKECDKVNFRLGALITFQCYCLYRDIKTSDVDFVTVSRSVQRM